MREKQLELFEQALKKNRTPAQLVSIIYAPCVREQLGLFHVINVSL